MFLHTCPLTIAILCRRVPMRRQRNLFALRSVDLRIVYLLRNRVCQGLMIRNYDVRLGGRKVKAKVISTARVLQRSNVA